MYLYKELYGNRVIQRLSDGAWIPLDPDNSDYQDVVKYLQNSHNVKIHDLKPTPDGLRLDETLKVDKSA